MLIVRRHDILLLREYTAHFYYALHYGLMANDQDIINTIVKHCGPNFFSIGLPGSTLLIMDFIYAADTVISSSDIKRKFPEVACWQVPRTEAMSILGALLCLTNVYKEIPTLQPSSTELFTIACKDAKDHITSILFKAGKREPAGLARCIAVNSIGIYLYEELMNKTNHYRIKEAVTVLLIAVRSSISPSANKPRTKEFNCKAVARVASDMLLLLCDHAEELRKNHSDSLEQFLASTLENLLPNSDAAIAEEDKKVGSPSVSEQDFVPLLSVFKVLNAAASGRKLDAPQGTQSLTELSTPDVRPQCTGGKFPGGYHPNPICASKITPELAAKSLMYHLINHLGHFPMGVGPSRMTSLVNEHDDVPNLTGDELSAEVFHAPNVQFFVLNSNSIVSFVEIPALDMPGGGATAGLTTSKSQVRIIIRDLGGKFSWDCSILYGPPDLYFSSPDMDPFSAPPSLDISQTLQPTSSLNKDGSILLSSQGLRHRPKDMLPTVENSADDLDNLDDLLQYIGYTSSECVINPGQPLNSTSHLQNEDGHQKEVEMIELILNQRNQEYSQSKKFSLNSCMEAKGVQSPNPADANSQFQHCRLLLNQMGFTSWERRSQFDLLKKNEQLLRELRNLDKQVCRDTHKIAVIYVAIGQEDKNSILSNLGASLEFEEFVAGLGWEVELENHPGFLGGLQRNKSTGDTAPYYATPFTEIPFFGPLFNGAIVGHKVLPGLVRATAINANRAKRSLISLYMNYFEERHKSLETIVQNHKDQTTFEQFAASVYSPAPSKTYAASRSSGPPSRADSSCSKGIPNLAAALLDAHSKGSAYSPSMRSRTVSQSTAEDVSPPQLGHRCLYEGN
ncbi:hypothetical protein CEXT_291451 [Caerostris extrusa]|uniref:Rap-GAP domain-containing protein n=1 Tax=Caerostris extrusa TaxID=172846 RepID=A0AAV4S1K2_CAEEX|nr:hypothetical protein CEXT_291451 [Caerostris extrusa]